MCTWGIQADSVLHQAYENVSLRKHKNNKKIQPNNTEKRESEEPEEEHEPLSYANAKEALTLKIRVIKSNYCFVIMLSPLSQSFSSLTEKCEDAHYHGFYVKLIRVFI